MRSRASRSRSRAAGKLVSTARAHALRGLRRRPHAAAPHDLPDVEARRRLPGRYVAHVHEWASEGDVRSGNALQWRRRRRGLGDRHARDRRRSATARSVARRRGTGFRRFRSRRARAASDDRSLVGDQALIDRLFATLDTEKAGYALLADEDLSFDYPHHAAHGHTDAASGTPRRRLSVVLCGDRRGENPFHRISLFGYDDAGRAALESIGLSVRPARRGSARLAVRNRQRRHGGDRRDASSASRGVLDVRVRYSARLARNDGQPTANCAAVHARVVGAAGHGHGRRARRLRRRRPTSSGCRLDEPVYDLDIDRTHNFVANGIVTHNSIYKFRGADFRNLLKFEEAVSGGGHGRARPELPVDATHPRRGERGDREQRVAPAEASLDRQGRGRADRPLPGRRRARRSRLRRARDPPPDRRRRSSLRRRRGLLPHQRAEPRARRVAGAFGRSVPRVRRREVLRPARDQGRARVPPRAGEPRRRSVVEAHREHAAAGCGRHVGREDRRVRERCGHSVPGRDRAGDRRRGERQGARRAPRSARAHGRSRARPRRAVSAPRSKRC